MYLEHFGLLRSPFEMTPDPSFLYLGDTHREGLATLVYGVRSRKGFLLLTGEVGTGKTTLLHALLSQLDASTASAFIFNPRLKWPMGGYLVAQAPWDDVRTRLNENLPRTTAKVESSARITRAIGVHPDSSDSHSPSLSARPAVSFIRVAARMNAIRDLALSFGGLVPRGLVIARNSSEEASRRRPAAPPPP